MIRCGRVPLKLPTRIADEIHKQSPDTVVKVFNIAKSDKNEVMTEVFKSRAIAVGSPTVSNSYPLKCCRMAGVFEAAEV
jgi:flavorubredoxin